MLVGRKYLETPVPKYLSIYFSMLLNLIGALTSTVPHNLLPPKHTFTFFYYTLSSVISTVTASPCEFFLEFVFGLLRDFWCTGVEKASYVGVYMCVYHDQMRSWAERATSSSSSEGDFPTSHFGVLLKKATKKRSYNSFSILHKSRFEILPRVCSAYIRSFIRSWQMSLLQYTENVKTRFYCFCIWQSRLFKLIF